MDYTCYDEFSRSVIGALFTIVHWLLDELNTANEKSTPSGIWKVNDIVTSISKVAQVEQDNWKGAISAILWEKSCLYLALMNYAHSKITCSQRIKSQQSFHQ